MWLSLSFFFSFSKLSSFWTKHWSTFSNALLCVSQCSLISMLMSLFFLPLNAPTLAPHCVAHPHLKWMAVDHRSQPLIAIAPLFSARTVVCCRECLHPTCFCNLSTTQSHSPQQRYYCHQDGQGPIGRYCAWDVHYSWIRNYFHTFGCSFDQRERESTAVLHVLDLLLCVRVGSYRHSSQTSSSPPSSALLVAVFSPFHSIQIVECDSWAVTSQSDLILPDC